MLEAIYADAADRGDEQAAPYVMTWVSRIALWKDEWPKGKEYAEAAYEASVSAPGELVFALAPRATVAALAGDVDAAREATEEGLRLAESTGMVSAWFGHQIIRGALELALGDVEAAYRFLAPVPAALERHGYAEPGIFRFHPDLIETLAACGRLGEASELMAELEGIAGRFPRSWAVPAAARCRGLLAAEASDHEEAFAQFDTALERHELLGERFERARTQLLYGVALRRAKRKRAARQALADARAVFEALGAAIWGDRARRGAQAHQRRGARLERPHRDRAPGGRARDRWPVEQADRGRAPHHRANCGVEPDPHLSQARRFLARAAGATRAAVARQRPGDDNAARAPRFLSRRLRPR